MGMRPLLVYIGGYDLQVLFAVIQGVPVYVVNLVSSRTVHYESVHINTSVYNTRLIVLVDDVQAQGPGCINGRSAILAVPFR